MWEPEIHSCQRNTFTSLIRRRAEVVMRSLMESRCIILPVSLPSPAWLRNPRGLFFVFRLLCFMVPCVGHSSHGRPIKPRLGFCILWTYIRIGCYDYLIFSHLRGALVTQVLTLTHHHLQGMSSPLWCLWMLGLYYSLEGDGRREWGYWLLDNPRTEKIISE